MNTLTFEQAMALPAGEDIEVFVEDQFHLLKIKKGIAFIEDRTSGTGISCYASIDSSGSVQGMQDRGSWKRGDKVVNVHGFKFNTNITVGEGKWVDLCEKLSRP